MFSYGGLVSKAFDTTVLVLLEMCFKLTCSLANVHLSTGAWYFVDVCLLLHREGVLDPSEEGMEGGSGPEHSSDIEVLTHPPDPFTNASYVRKVDSG